MDAGVDFGGGVEIVSGSPVHRVGTSVKSKKTACFLSFIGRPHSVPGDARLDFVGWFWEAKSESGTPQDESEIPEERRNSTCFFRFIGTSGLVIGDAGVDFGGGVEIVAGRPTIFGQLRLQERKQVAMRRVDGPETKKSQETGQGTPWTVDGKNQW